MTEKCIKVLLIEDNPGDARLIREILQEETSPRFDLEDAERLDDGLRRLAKGGIDVVLLDLSLPDSQGIDTLHRAHAGAPGVPIVVLTGLADHAVAAEALKAGGQDYLNKGMLNYCILHRSLERATMRRCSEEDRHLAEETAAPGGRDRDEFQATVGDEVHASMARVLATVSAVMDEPGTAAELLPALALIRHRVELEARLVDDLLMYSRLETGGGPFPEIDCQAVVDGVLSNLKASIDRAGARVAHGPLPSVRADAAQLGQLFRQLIGNAIKFRGEAAPLIELTARRQGEEWLFSIRDNGIGFDPKHAEHIFAIFRRLHDRDRYPGTGIGLAICKKIVERHGGRIRAESEPGRGSCFSFTIPAPTVARS